MKLSIRKVRPLDIGALHKMSTDFGKEVDLPYPILDDKEIDNKLLYVLSHLQDPEFLFLIAYDGKKPVGFFMGFITEREYSRPTKVGMSQELYVVPSKRGGQVARGLMREAWKYFSENEVGAIECVGSYGKTDKMWEEFGFILHLSYGHILMEDATKRFGHSKSRDSKAGG